MPVSIANWIRFRLEPNSPDLPSFFPVSLAHSVDAIVQTGAFDSVLVVDKLSSTEHPPAAMRTVGVLVQCSNRNVVGIIHSSWYDLQIGDFFELAVG